MKPKDLSEEQEAEQQYEPIKADVYDEPSSAPDVPKKQASAGVFIGLVVAGIVLLGTAGYFIWQTTSTFTKGSSQQQTGGDIPNIDSKNQTPNTNRIM